MLRFFSFAVAASMLLAILLVAGCSQQQKSAQAPPSQRVAGTQEMATTVHVTLTSTGLTLNQKMAPVGNITFSVMNSMTKPATVVVMEPNKMKKVSGVIQPGKTASIMIANAPKGTYQVYVSGQTKAAMKKTLTVSVPKTTVTTKGTTKVVGTTAMPLMATISTTGVKWNAKQVMSGDVYLQVMNSSTKPQTVMITGPNKFSKKMVIQPGKSASIEIPNARVGAYTMSVTGMKTKSTFMVVAAPKVKTTTTTKSTSKTPSSY